MFTGNSWLNPKLEVRESSTHSKGVFAKEEVKKGEKICIFGGSVLLINQIDNLPEHMQEYAYQIEERFVLANTSDEPEATDYFNHSCDPNCGFRGQIFLVAMRDIKRDEEVTFDYAMTISESVGSDIVFDLDCNCGSPLCRKRITEADWKLPELRRKYKGYFGQYLQDEIEAG